MSSWVSDAVFYQIFPDRFARSPRLAKPARLEPWGAPPTHHGYQGGDLLGVAERLDWLSALGIDAIYFCPIFRSASNHRYHTHDYYAVDPLLGGDEAFTTMLDACHARGIRVILDGVFNHASRGFFPFHDLLENGPASPWIDWFTVRKWPLHAYGGGEPGYDAWWSLPALPKLNTDHPEVREYLMRVAEHWIRRGIDGWRLDVPTEITTPGFWEEMARRVRAIRADAYLVGEIWEDASAWIADGARFDGTMNYPFASAVLRFAGGERVPAAETRDTWPLVPAVDAVGYADAIDALLARYPGAAAAKNLNLLGSHDTPRLRTLCGGSVDAVVLATVLLFTFPGAPCVYYGDEIGLEGGRDPACRGAFPWDDEASWDQRILAAHRELSALRRAHAELRRGAYRRVHAAGGLYVFARETEAARIVVAVNAGTSPASAAIDLGEAAALWGEGRSDAQGIHVPSRRAAIWRADPDGGVNAG